MKKCVILIAFILLLGFVTASIEIIGDENDRVINLDSISEAITTFLGLTDTPLSYTGEGGNCVLVNVGETALEFGACGGVGAGDKWIDGGTYIYPNSSFAENIIVFGYIQAEDWSNLTALTDTLYAGKEWGHNQTTPANTYTDTVNTSQSTWVTNTFLSIANALTQYFNKTDIQEQYYNKSDIDANNALWTSTYNKTYAGSVNNASYLSTHNETYANILDQQCPFGYVVNGTYQNGTFTCIEDQSGSGADNGYFFNVTTGTHTGNLTYEGYVSYEAGNAICNSNFTGTHMCSQEEIIQTIQAKNVSLITAWTGTFYVSAGGAKYAPADLPVNDCNGWTWGTAGSYLGNFWLPSTTGGGKGGVAHCGNERALACCKNY